jgi:thiosulfate dehydrogenase [quinone] large subunit
MDPPAARLLFNDTRFAVVWLIVRVLAGLTWIDQASHKLGDPAWMQTGEALKGFWTNAVMVPDTGRPAIAFGWYRSLIQAMLDNGWYVWFAKLVAVGEFLVGVALVVGFLVGISAFFGAFMNWNYLMAGSASINPILFVAALLLMFAWKTAGYYGLDRWIVPHLGTSWEPQRQAVRSPRNRAVTPPPASAAHTGGQG